MKQLNVMSLSGSPCFTPLVDTDKWSPIPSVVNHVSSWAAAINASVCESMPLSARMLCSNTLFAKSSISWSSRKSKPFKWSIRASRVYMLPITIGLTIESKAASVWRGSAFFWRCRFHDCIILSTYCFQACPCLGRLSASRDWRAKHLASADWTRNAPTLQQTDHRAQLARRV